MNNSIFANNNNEVENQKKDENKDACNNIIKDEHYKATMNTA